MNTLSENELLNLTGGMPMIQPIMRPPPMPPPPLINGGHWLELENWDYRWHL